jgi:cytochrome P450
MAVEEIYYDPYDYTIDADPHPIWKRMRDDAPLYHNEKFNFFALSRYADVRKASLDAQTYSSAYGTLIEIIDVVREQPGVLDLSGNFLFEDPPIHDVHRAILAPAFTARRIASLEPMIRDLSAASLDRLAAVGRFDFVRDFGAKLPPTVIGMLMGWPEEDLEDLAGFSDEGLHLEEGETAQGGGGYGSDAQRKMFEYFSQLIERRRAEPGDDLTTVLLQAEVDDGDGGKRRLDERELLGNLSLVAGAGTETTVNLLGWAALTLYRHPDQRQMLADDPSLISNAVEELLRYEAPSPIQARVVTRDVEHYGQTVPEGSKIVLLTGSANRDDRVWSDPDRFDVSRHIEPQHVTFGVGLHFCLGAAMARLEGRIVLEEMLKRFPEWKVDEDAAEMVHTSTVRGWARLPISV